MRLIIPLLASTAAVTLATPAGAQDRVVSCETEVSAFLETLRGDDRFPIIESTVEAFEADLAEAARGEEGTCYALLADVQTTLREEGFVIAGASDAAAVERTRRLAARDHFDMRDGDSAVVAADRQSARPRAEADVTVESAPAEVTVRQAEPDVTIVEPGEEADVEIVEPDDATPPDRRAAGPSRSAGAPASAARRSEDDTALAPGRSGAAGPAPDPSAGATRSGGGGMLRIPAVPAASEVEAEAAGLVAIEALSVREVEFGFDSATVPLDETAQILAEIAEIVAEAPDSAVLLTGYASPIGDRRYNMELSEARVDAVRDALLELGVPSGAILGRSLGERNTEVTADEGERSPPNRRVEIRILDLAERGG